MKFWQFNAQKHSDRLAARLRKFCLDGQTPEKELSKGILWGRGQVEIALSAEESWRGLIKSHELKISDTGVTVVLELYWFARKITFQKPEMIGGSAIWELKPKKTWRWDAIRHTYKTDFTIKSFYQDKANPKHLFFKTVSGENGFFSQRNDPHNISLVDNGIHDPQLIAEGS